MQGPHANKTRQNGGKGAYFFSFTILSRRSENPAASGLQLASEMMNRTVDREETKLIEHSMYIERKKLF